MNEAERLGATMGVIAAHSWPVVEEAVSALAKGEATSEQQIVAWQFLSAATRGTV